VKEKAPQTLILHCAGALSSKSYELEVGGEDSKPWPDSSAREDAEPCRREVTYILI